MKNNPTKTDRSLTTTISPASGAGRARAAGRLLPEPGRLVGAERGVRRSRPLRLPVVGSHQPGDAALRPGRRWRLRHVRLLERAGECDAAGCVWGGGGEGSHTAGRIV